MNEHYTVAVMLHPEYKDQWLIDKWRRFPQWKTGALANTEFLFNKYVEEADLPTDDELESARQELCTQHQNSSTSSDDETLDWRTSQPISSGKRGMGSEM